jgi:hypothetical protein
MLVEPGHVGRIRVQLAEQAEDDEDAGVGVPRPEERLLEVGRVPAAPEDPEQEQAAELNGDDRQEQNARDLLGFRRDRQGVRLPSLSVVSAT